MKRFFLTLIFLNLTLGTSQDTTLENLSFQLAQQTQDSTKVNTSFEIIKLLFKSKDYTKALIIINQSELLANEINFTKGLANITYYKGKILNEIGKPQDAVTSFKTAKSLYASINDSATIAKVNSTLGRLEIEHGKLEDGLLHSLQSIKQLEKRKFHTELSKTYESLAKAYTKSGDMDKAISSNLKKIDSDLVINNTKGLIEANKNLGDIFRDEGNTKLSLNYYENALSHTTAKDKRLRAAILPYIASASLENKEHKAAARYLNESLKLNRKLDNKKETLITLNKLAELNLKRRRYTSADRQLVEAGNLARVTNNDKQLLLNYKLMQVLDSTKGNFENAFSWQREYHKLKNKINKKESLNVPKPIVKATIKDSIQTVPLSAFSTPKQNLAIIKKLDKFKLVFYALLTAFAIVSIFFVLFYLKKNKKTNYTIELESKNKKIESQNEAIKKHSKRLEQINDAKDKLFSIVSHDLKDTLTSTKGFIDLLKEGELSKDEYHSLLPELSQNADNASLLLFNLLNWSKSQMQSLDSKPSLFDIQDVFSEKVKLFDKKLEEKGITFINNTISDFIYADKNMIGIVIHNLLANAVKFCEKGDSIALKNKFNDSKAIISVVDTGVGISTENQGKLFKDITFSTQGTNLEAGTGLGLSICKELVELNSGTIWVESTLNVGSAFYIELPKEDVNISKLQELAER